MCFLKDINGYTFWLTCKTPALQFPGENITVNNPKDVHYGFNLDGVTTYRNISLTFGAMEYYPDPIVHMFDGDDHRVEYKKGQQLIIKVRLFKCKSSFQGFSSTFIGIQVLSSP
jgi:hypothetical protein